MGDPKTYVVEGLTKPHIDRLVRLQQEDIYNMTGQLVIATRNVSDRKVTGGKRERSERALRAIPEQIEAATEAREALIAALRSQGS